MGLLPTGADILPPSDDRVFKLILTSPEAEQGLMNLISSVIGRTVVDVILLPNELAPGDKDEKAERFDVNCKIDDGSQINLEMQASRIVEDLDGQYRNIKGKSVYYQTCIHPNLQRGSSDMTVWPGRIRSHSALIRSSLIRRSTQIRFLCGMIPRENY